MVFSRKAVRLRALGSHLMSVHVNALAHTGQCREAAFCVAALSKAPVAGGGGLPSVPAGWRELEARCVQIAADRAKQERSATPAAGDDAGDAAPPAPMTCPGGEGAARPV